MSEIKKIYQCVLEKSYLNKIELSILLDSLSDRKLVKGFLNNICILNTRYEIDEDYKNELLLLYIETFGEDSTDDIKETAEYFNVEIQKVFDEEISDTKQRIESLNTIIEYMGSDKDKSILEKCDLKALKSIKNILLESEMYVDIIVVDELINKLK